MQSSGSEIAISVSNAESGLDAKPVSSIVDQPTTSARPNISVYSRFPQMIPAYHVMRIPPMGAHPTHLSHHHHHGLSARPPSSHPHHPLWGPHRPLMAPPPPPLQFSRNVPQAMAPLQSREHMATSSGGAATDEMNNTAALSVNTPNSNCLIDGAPHDAQEGYSTQKNTMAKKHGVKWTPSEVSSLHVMLTHLYSN